MVDKKVSVILLIAGSLCLVSVILSLYSLSTANWSMVGQYNIGLFQTCFNSHCIKNTYGERNYEANSPPIFANRLFNAGPLAITSVVLQLIVCLFCFLTAFIYLPVKPSMICYVTPVLIFIAFIFQFSAIAEASYGIYLNGRSSVVFETALVLQVIVMGLTAIAADRIHHINSILYV